MDSSGLLVNLAVALGAAFLGSLVAVRLRQSVIIGYILAGLAIGPFTPGFVEVIRHVFQRYGVTGMELVNAVRGLRRSFYEPGSSDTSAR